MEENLLEIESYLPIYYQRDANGEFVKYLIQSTLLNYTSGYHQVAFLVFHLLYMSFIYKTLWILRLADIKEICEFYDSNNELKNSSNPFDASVVGEKNILKQLKCLGFHSNEIKDFSSLVDRRDNCAHSAGLILYSDLQVDRMVDEALEYIAKIHKGTQDSLAKIFEEFVEANWDPGKREFSSLDDSIDYFVRINYLSLKDLARLHSTVLQENSKGKKEILLRKVLVSIFKLYCYKLGVTDKNELLPEIPSIMELTTDLDDYDITRIVLDEYYSVFPTLSKEDQEEFREISKIDIEEV